MWSEVIFLGAGGGVEAARSRFDPGNMLPWDITVLVKTHIFFFVTVCIGKSTPVLLTLLIPALVSPLSNRCCRYAGDRITEWMSGGQPRNWLCGESLIHGITSEIWRQRAGCVCVLVNIKWFDFSKGGCFLWLRLAYLHCCLPTPIFPMKKRITRKTRYRMYPAFPPKMLTKILRKEFSRKYLKFWCMPLKKPSHPNAKE